MSGTAQLRDPNREAHSAHPNFIFRKLKIKRAR